MRLIRNIAVMVAVLGLGFLSGDKHMFRWASISKIPMSIAVMQLVEQGKVDLDTDISTYLEDLSLERVSDAPITVRHLFTHTAGFEERWLVNDVITDSPKLVFEPGHDGGRHGRGTRRPSLFPGGKGRPAAVRCWVWLAWWLGHWCCSPRLGT